MKFGSEAKPSIPTAARASADIFDGRKRYGQKEGREKERERKENRKLDEMACERGRACSKVGDIDSAFLLFCLPPNVRRVKRRGKQLGGSYRQA